MPYALAWLSEPHILHARIWDELTLSEIRQANAEVTRLLDAATVPIHLVVDVSEMTAFPRSVTDMYGAAKYFRHPKFGWEILYGVQSVTLEIILGILTQLMPLRYGIVDSLKEALKFLSAKEPQLQEVITRIDMDD